MRNGKVEKHHTRNHERNACHAQPRQVLTEDRHAHNGDAYGSHSRPDGIGGAQPDVAKRQPQQSESKDLAGDNSNRRQYPGEAFADLQHHGAEDLEDDCAHQEHPRHGFLPKHAGPMTPVRPSCQWHTRPMDARDQLTEIIEKGAPAQAAKARELLDRMATAPDDASIHAQTDALFDAYLHDPYLTKVESSAEDHG